MKEEQKRIAGGTRVAQEIDFNDWAIKKLYIKNF